MFEVPKKNKKQNLLDHLFSDNDSDNDIEEKEIIQKNPRNRREKMNDEWIYSSDEEIWDRKKENYKKKIKETIPKFAHKKIIKGPEQVLDYRFDNITNDILQNKESKELKYKKYILKSVLSQNDIREPCYIYVVHNQTSNIVSSFVYNKNNVPTYPLHIFTPQKSIEGSICNLYLLYVFTNSYFLDKYSTSQYNPIDVIRFDFITEFQIPFFSELSNKITFFNPHGKRNYSIQMIISNYGDKDDHYEIFIDYVRKNMKLSCPWKLQNIRIVLHKDKEKHIAQFFEEIEDLEGKAEKYIEEDCLKRLKESLHQENNYLQKEQEKLYQELFQNKKKIKHIIDKIIKTETELENISSSTNL